MTDRADDVAEEQDGETEEVKPSSKKKLILFGLIGLLLLGGGGGAAAYFLGVFDSGEAETAAAAPAPDPVFFYDLPEITVNLQTVDDREMFLKMRVALELEDQSVVAKIEPFLPRILDAFQFYLHEVRSTDLEGSAGLFRLKEELHRRINQAVYPIKVGDVLFKEILVQ